MNENHVETLSAFFDGEPVDPAALAEGLAQPGAAALLAEFAALRSHAQSDAVRPDPLFVESLRSKLEDRQPGFLRRRALPFAAAASLALATGLVGFMLGMDSSQSGVPLVAPPPVALDMHPQPQPAGRATTSVPAVPAGHQLASVTRKRKDTGAPPEALIRLRFSNWRDLPGNTEENQRH